jgi:hypothetical protein
MSLASHAALKSLMMTAFPAAAARWAAGVAGAPAARTRRRAEEASWRQAAGVRGPADDAGHLGEGEAEDVVQHERDALGRGHRLQHDQEGHRDRLVERDPVGRVGGGRAGLLRRRRQRFGQPFAHVELAPGPG